MTEFNFFEAGETAETEDHFLNEPSGPLTVSEAVVDPSAYALDEIEMEDVNTELVPDEGIGEFEVTASTTGLRNGTLALAALVFVVGGAVLTDLSLLGTLTVSAFVVFGLSIVIIVAERRKASKDMRALWTNSTLDIQRSLAVSVLKVLQGTKRDRSLKKKLLQAGVKTSPASWLLSRVVVFLVIAGGLIGINQFAFAIPALLIPILNIFYIFNRSSKRKKTFDHALPDVLMTTSAAMKAASGFEQALETAIKESSTPAIREELGAGMISIQQGHADPGEVWLAIAETMDSAGLRMTGQAYKVTKATGGPMADVLAAAADSIREQLTLESLIAAEAAEGRLSGVILMLLPIALTLGVWRLAPEFFEAMFSPIGYALFGVCLLYTSPSPRDQRGSRMPSSA